MHKASGLSWLILLFIFGVKFMFFIGIDAAKAKLDCSLLVDVAAVNAAPKPWLIPKPVLTICWLGERNNTPPTTNSMPFWKARVFITNKRLWPWRMPVSPCRLLIRPRSRTLAVAAVSAPKTTASIA